MYTCKYVYIHCTLHTVKYTCNRKINANCRLNSLLNKCTSTFTFAKSMYNLPQHRGGKTIEDGERGGVWRGMSVCLSVTRDWIWDGDEGRGFLVRAGSGLGGWETEQLLEGEILARTDRRVVCIHVNVQYVCESIRKNYECCTCLCASRRRQKLLTDNSIINKMGTCMQPNEWRNQ